MHSKSRFGWIAALGLSLLATNAAAQAPEKLSVVASFSILGDLIREVGGDKVEVKTWSDRTETSMSTSRAPPMRRASPRQSSSSSTAWRWRAGWAPDRGLRRQGAGCGGDQGRGGARRIGRGRKRPRSPRLAEHRQRQDLCRQYPGRPGSPPIRRRRLFPRAGAKTRSRLDATERRPRGDRANTAWESPASSPPMTPSAISVRLTDFVHRAGRALEDSEPSAKDVARLIGQIRREKAPAVFLGKHFRSAADAANRQECGAKLGGELF